MEGIPAGPLTLPHFKRSTCDATCSAWHLEVVGADRMPTASRRAIVDHSEAGGAGRAKGEAVLLCPLDLQPTKILTAAASDVPAAPVWEPPKLRTQSDDIGHV